MRPRNTGIRDKVILAIREELICPPPDSGPSYLRAEEIADRVLATLYEPDFLPGLYFTGETVVEVLGCSASEPDVVVFKDLVGRWRSRAARTDVWGWTRLPDECQPDEYKDAS